MQQHQKPRVHRGTSSTASSSNIIQSETRICDITLIKQMGASSTCSLVKSKPVKTQLLSFVFTVPRVLSTQLITKLGGKKILSIINVFPFTRLEMEIYFILSFWIHWCTTSIWKSYWPLTNPVRVGSAHWEIKLLQYGFFMFIKKLQRETFTRGD